MPQLSDFEWCVHNYQHYWYHVSWYLSEGPRCPNFSSAFVNRYQTVQGAIPRESIRDEARRRYGDF